MLLIVYFALLFFSIPTALTFLVLFAISRRRACLIAGLLWLLPVPYEFLVQTNCTGECNIRVDMLLVLPLEARSPPVWSTLRRNSRFPWPATLSRREARGPWPRPGRCVPMTSALRVSAVMAPSTRSLSNASIP